MHITLGIRVLTMLFGADYLNQKAAELLADYGTAVDFLVEKVLGLWEWLQKNPERWQEFGPYWQFMKPLLLKYSDATEPEKWSLDYDYLSHYGTDDELLNELQG